ncbi:MAG TPA: hypothetical protein VE971_00255 [Candidatus Eisenbacteria bacterium]|nr:hypothetical protein [Candidatus Eisenbacteria bacterium]
MKPTTKRNGKGRITQHRTNSNMRYSYIRLGGKLVSNVYIYIVIVSYIESRTAGEDHQKTIQGDKKLRMLRVSS